MYRLAPIGWFDSTHMGSILNRFGKDIDIIDTQLPENVVTLASLFLQIFVVVLFAVIATPYFLIPMVPMLFVFHYLQALFRKVSTPLKRLESVSRTPVFSSFGETLRGNFNTNTRTSKQQ
jgi:ABC-type transport system involved in cytochrome bd biosynthesis fused ATPase/permease subunit